MLVVALVGLLFVSLSHKWTWSAAAFLLVAVDSARLYATDKCPSKMGQFWAHWAPGIFLCKGGALALVGDGGPLVVHWTIGLLGTLGAVAHFCLEATGMRRYDPRPAPFYIWAHLIAILLEGLAIGSVGSESLLRCFAGKAAVARLRSIRQLLDPVVLTALGILLRYHQHDKSPLGLAWHATFGFLLICIAITQLGSTLVHAVLSHEAAASKLLQSMHSFAWLLSGIYFGMMGVVLYADGGGVHGWMADQGIKAHDANEEGMTYLSLSMVLALFLLCALTILGDAGGKVGGTLGVARGSPTRSQRYGALEQSAQSEGDACGANAVCGL